MSLLDSVLGSVLGGNNNSGNNSLQGALLQAVITQMLGGLLGSLLGGGAQAQQQAGTQMAGGLGNLTDMLSQLGLGDQVKSWVGTGENLPVTAEQIQNSLGQNGTLGQIASQAGVSETEAAGGLAELLPGLINKLTPNGQIDANDITSILGSLLGGNKQ